MTDRVLIVDFGSQVTQLIARRVRETGVYCEIHPFNKVTADSIETFGPQGVILSGGPASVHHTDTPRAPDDLFEMGLPVLGICYGEQTMCAQLGAEGVLAMFCDSTNIDRRGYTGSEAEVEDAFEEIFTSTEGKIIVSTFSSSLYRLQKIGRAHV